MVAAAPGTQMLIGLLPRLFPARDVAVLAPTYAEHAAAWRAGGAAVRAVATLEAAASADVVVLCNPNNPDGRVTPAAALLALADRLAERGGRLLVDEAFADLERPDPSLARHLPHPALILLRSFGKTYGLAGLRLGFALAAPDTAARIRAALGPWAVAGPAIAVGRAALCDAAWLEAARARLAADAARLDGCLAGAGLAAIGGTLLFRLARHAEARTIHDRLGRAGILVRRFDENREWLRFGIPADKAAWQRLRAALGLDPE